MSDTSYQFFNASKSPNNIIPNPKIPFLETSVDNLSQQGINISTSSRTHRMICLSPYNYY